MKKPRTHKPPEDTWAVIILVIVLVAFCIFFGWYCNHALATERQKAIIGAYRALRNHHRMDAVRILNEAP